MVVFAFLAGIAVVGLTLYSSAIDHIRDYGTMKAIGATNGYIRQLLYMQAMMFAIPGFLIGQVLVQIFKYAIESQGLLIQFTPQFYIYFFLLVCVIALSGAALASRRIIRLEPAEVFRF
jgi:putative ABC transport system permease protein